MRSLLLVSALSLAACADNTPASGALTAPSGGDITRGVTQGGAQDIARFRAIVQQGEIPSLSTLDATGFLAEHALDLPPATCGVGIWLGTNPFAKCAIR